MMNSLRDELNYLFSGQGMPYEKVSIMIAVIITLLFSAIYSNNIIEDAHVAVIDLDNSKYSHEIISQIEASPFMEVTAVLNSPAEPNTLFYQDKNIAVVYLPKDLEKNRYTDHHGTIGAFYDNTNSAQTSGVKEALNEIISIGNAKADPNSSGGITLSTRTLFNPSGSTSNSTTLGFLFFFSSIFFGLATIGIVPRLRMTGRLRSILQNGTPFDLAIRLVPYGLCLLTALFIGLAILRTRGDMLFEGHVITFLLIQLFCIAALGIMSLLVGWSAANPGIASGRMILFVPGGFILGGIAGPIPILPEWARILSHIFPLTWEFHFTRDILLRGAGFADISFIFGLFLLYLAALCGILYFVFYRERSKLMAIEAATSYLPENEKPLKEAV